MDREQEMIHHQMEATRADLTDKLSALESQVSGTVQAATNAVETTRDAVTGTVEAVTDTVESVKESVQETVESVTDKVSETVGNVAEQFQETVKSISDTFNLRLQAERHPWLVLGGAFAAGCLGGYLLGGARRSSPDFPAGYRSGGEARSDGGTTQAQPEQSQNKGPSMLGAAAGAVGSAVGSVASNAAGALGGLFGEQLGHLKGLAIGAMMGVVRDLAARSLPENIKDRVTEEVDNLTRNLGGEPIKGSILPEPKADESEQSQEGGHEYHPPANYGGVGRSETATGRPGQPALARPRR